jgi:hypothetical protein
LPYNYFGNIITTGTSSGTITYNEISKATGCDSIVHLHLTVNDSIVENPYLTICDNRLPYNYFGNIIPTGTSSGTITYNEISNATGCDSIVHLHLTVNPVYSDTITATICLGESYTQNGFNVTPNISGHVNYYQNLPTIHGCDSIITLQLTVHPAFNDTINAEICLGETYNQNGFNITPTQAGFVSNTHFSFTTFGCDSITTLNLTVHLLYHDTINAKICLGEVYNQNGFNIFPTQTGFSSHTRNLSSIYGCDSIVTLQLTVYPVYHDTITAEICLGETYSQYGFNATPSISGPVNYYQNLTTVNGCDSIIVLKLTVNPSYNYTIRAAICVGENYNQYGFDIAPAQPGFLRYTHSYTTAKGCDSILTLELTVNPTYNVFITDTIYEDEFCYVGNNQYNTPGLHISYLISKFGCDSIVNLNLHVIYYPPEITAFSPFNKDGVNDYLYPGFKVKIFNRYGAIIYETKTPEQQSLGWDGRNNNGEEVEPGLYFYIMYNSRGKPRIKSSVETLKM